MGNRFFYSSCLFIVVVFGLICMESILVDKEEQKYFKSPEEAVQIISRLLEKDDWKTLSLYYDLSGTDIDRKDLESGQFFVRFEDELREISHPGGFDRYKHPFAPGSKYSGHEKLDTDRIKVRVSIEIDQGGGMVQRGIKTFLMQEFLNGYRVLPDIVD